MKLSAGVPAAMTLKPKTSPENLREVFASKVGFADKADLAYLKVFA
jgi:hypothetical protein